MMAANNVPLQRRYPAEALLAASGCEYQTHLARKIGMDLRQLGRYFRDGIPERSADRLAVRCGLHPSEVWPEWFEGAA